VLLIPSLAISSLELPLKSFSTSKSSGHGSYSIYLHQEREQGLVPIVPIPHPLLRKKHSAMAPKDSQRLKNQQEDPALRRQEVIW